MILTIHHARCKSPAHEWWRAERMPQKPVGGTLEQEPVEALVGYRFFDLADQRPGQTEGDPPQRKINQVRLPEPFHQRRAAVPEGPDLVMHFNHPGDLTRPASATGCLQVPIGFLHRGRDVVHRLRRPQADIVETRRDRQLGPLIFRGWLECQAEVEDAVDMAPVSGEILADHIPPGGENLLDEGVVGNYLHGSTVWDGKFSDRRSCRSRKSPGLCFTPLPISPAKCGIFPARQSANRDKRSVAAFLLADSMAIGEYRSWFQPRPAHR